MSVMNCGRPSCESVMCDTHIPSIGYICPECIEEFKRYAEIKGIKKTHDNILAYLIIFMHTFKGMYADEISCGIDEFFDEFTN